MWEAIIGLGQTIAGGISSSIVAANERKAVALMTEAEKLKSEKTNAIITALIIIAALILGTILIIFKPKKWKK
jgi:hypothetical protein